jgi:hypothetical protein
MSFSQIHGVLEYFVWFYFIIIIIIIWFVRLVALRPLLAYCASLG